MRYRIVAVRDRAADCFAVPHFVASVGAAIRSFGDQINSGDAQNALCLHPEDFDLYDLGSFDDESACFTCDKGPRQIAVGKDLKVKKETGDAPQ